MKGDRPYLAECQVIRQAKNNDIPKYGKLRSKRWRNGRQNTTFYNAINALWEIE